MFFPDGRPKSRIRLRPEIAKGGRPGDVFLPAALVRKLEAFWAYKLGRRERLDATAPLFCQSRPSADLEAPGPGRLSCVAGDRRLREALPLPRSKAHGGHERLPGVPAYLFLAQRFARHASPLTTTIYTHPSDEELHSSGVAHSLLALSDPSPQKDHVLRELLVRRERFHDVRLRYPLSRLAKLSRPSEPYAHREACSA